jgi:hypothetical protein
MRAPNMARMTETFVMIGTPNDANRARQRYFGLLRTRVSPLVEDLRRRCYIGWFSFLVHNRKSGSIPVPEGDNRLYIHLRFERLPRVSHERLRASLPDFCEHTRPMRRNVSHSLGPVDTSALIEPEIATGWGLFGSSSEWVLQFVCSHRDSLPIPNDNVRQFFHYIENQLWVW